MIRSILRRLLTKRRHHRVFGAARRFSNDELAKFAHVFNGSVVNVSGWTDLDKHGNRYKQYFSGADKYFVSNFASDQKGMCGIDNEFFLDLEQPLPEQYQNAFDVVFNHTTLEHVFDSFTAFGNMASMSRDVLIIVVPYIQQVHGTGYLDYWRFTPHAMKRLYETHSLKLRYCTANGSDRASIYLFCIGYRDDKWDQFIPDVFSLKLDEDKALYGPEYRNIIGGRVLP